MISQKSSNVFQLYFNNFGSCVYVLKLNKIILIDTSSPKNKEELLEDLKQLNINPEQVQIVLKTHNHWDHIGNIDLFPNALIYDYSKIDLIEKEIPELKIIKTPGHTQDSMCVLYKDILFSGDTIFHENGIGRTDFQESQPEEMKNSLNKLKKLQYKILCPGHI